MARRARSRVIDFSDCVMPRVIDFRRVLTPREELQEQFEAYLKWREGAVVRVYFNALDPYEEDKGGNAHTRPVPAYRMKRARRVLWQCQQHPDWPHKPSMFYRHPSLKNVPYRVLKNLMDESEGRNA